MPAHYPPSALRPFPPDSARYLPLCSLTAKQSVSAVLAAAEGRQGIHIESEVVTPVDVAVLPVQKPCPPSTAASAICSPVNSALDASSAFGPAFNKSTMPRLMPVCDPDATATSSDRAYRQMRVRLTDYDPSNNCTKVIRRTSGVQTAWRGITPCDSDHYKQHYDVILGPSPNSPQPRPLLAKELVLLSDLIERGVPHLMSWDLLDRECVVAAVLADDAAEYLRLLSYYGRPVPRLRVSRCRLMSVLDTSGDVIACYLLENKGTDNIDGLTSDEAAATTHFGITQHQADVQGLIHFAFARSIQRAGGRWQDAVLFSQLRGYLADGGCLVLTDVVSHTVYGTSCFRDRGFGEIMTFVNRHGDYCPSLPCADLADLAGFPRDLCPLPDLSRNPTPSAYWTREVMHRSSLGDASQPFDVRVIQLTEVATEVAGRVQILATIAGGAVGGGEELWEKPMLIGI